MKTEKEIKDKLIFVRHKIWRNGYDSNVWEKVEEYLNWVLEPSASVQS